MTFLLEQGKHQCGDEGHHLEQGRVKEEVIWVLDCITPLLMITLETKYSGTMGGNFLPSVFKTVEYDFLLLYFLPKVQINT